MCHVKRLPTNSPNPVISNLAFYCVLFASPCDMPGTVDRVNTIVYDCGNVGERRVADMQENEGRSCVLMAALMLVMGGGVTILVVGVVEFVMMGAG